MAYQRFTRMACLDSIDSKHNWLNTWQICANLLLGKQALSSKTPQTVSEVNIKKLSSEEMLTSFDVVCIYTKNSVTKVIDTIRELTNETTTKLMDVFYVTCFSRFRNNFMNM